MLSIFACVCIVGPMQGTSKWLSINSCLFITNPNRITHLLNTPSLRWLILLKHTCYYVILQQLFIKIDQPAFLVFFELVLITKVPWFFIFIYSLPKKWRDNRQTWCLLVEMDSSRIHSSHPPGKSLTKNGIKEWPAQKIVSGKR